MRPAGMVIDANFWPDTSALPASVILVLELRACCSMVTVRRPVGVRAEYEVSSSSIWRILGPLGIPERADALLSQTFVP